MSITENVMRVLGYDASRTWADFGKSLVPCTEQSKKGWEAVGVAFKNLGALFLKSQVVPSSEYTPVSGTIVLSETGEFKGQVKSYFPLGRLFPAVFPSMRPPVELTEEIGLEKGVSRAISAADGMDLSDTAEGNILSNERDPLSAMVIGLNSTETFISDILASSEPKEVEVELKVAATKIAKKKSFQTLSTIQKRGWTPSQIDEYTEGLRKAQEQGLRILEPKDLKGKDLDAKKKYYENAGITVGNRV